MKIKLIEWTRSPERISSMAWEVMQKDINPIIDGELHYTNDSMDNFVKQLKKEALGTPFEFINMVWYIDGVSRAFTHQLVRHRVGWSFAQQSMRVVPKYEFAKNGNYHIPQNVKHSDQYNVAMHKVEEVYNRLIEMGEDPEVARGVLPTNIHTTIMAACSYRAWRNMAIQRSCTRAQGEFAQVVREMKKEVEDKMGPQWAEVYPSCEYSGVCMIPSQWEKCRKEKTMDGRRVVH